MIELILAMESKRKRKASEKLVDDDENEKKVSKITSKTIDKKLGKYAVWSMIPNEIVK